MFVGKGHVCVFYVVSYFFAAIAFNVSFMEVVSISEKVLKI